MNDNTSRPAVLVIDVQQGLCAGRHAAFEAAEVIQRINGLTDRARAAPWPSASPSPWFRTDTRRWTPRWTRR